MSRRDHDMSACQVGGRGRILIAATDELLRRLLGEYREDKEYLVHLTADGEQVLEAAPDLVPDLVLLDMSMPKLSGLEVGRRLRATRNAARRNLRILMLSALVVDVARSAS